MQVHLIDGTYELFRAWFGAPPAQHAGREVGAVRSLVRSLAMLLGRGTITHAGVAFDHVIESFRNDLFAGYKTGEGVPEGLFAQFELAERAVTAMGLVAWPMIEFEADDAIGTAAHHLANDPAVEQVRITAVDKDMCQCVIGTRVVCWDRFKDVVLDEAAVVAKHGVMPASIPDLLALVGDTADGIPGLPGWGKSSAAKVLAVYGTLDAIPDDHATWSLKLRGADRLAATLREQRTEATLYRLLATLARLSIVCDAVAWRSIAAIRPGDRARCRLDPPTAIRTQMVVDLAARAQGRAGCAVGARSSGPPGPVRRLLNNSSCGYSSPSCSRLRPPP
ncbi:MAG: 5'-3' exonuclease H3TH domain-containing protein [Kofleriaceae bacterium]